MCKNFSSNLFTAKNMYLKSIYRVFKPNPPLNNTFEYRKLHVNGTIVLLECKGTPIITSTEETEGFVFVLRDVTEKRQAEKKMQNSEKLSVIGHLAASIAHEVRNPLTAIKGFVQLFCETQPPKKH
jgi:two-component system sporulation sensor kinase A